MLAFALLPAQPAGAATTIPDGTESTAGIQQIGPGQYFSDTRTFEVGQTDVSAGSIGRRHAVVAPDGGPAIPEPVPASRPELSVFGPGWEAEFLGGTINRKLETRKLATGNDAVVVTDLTDGTSTTYELRGGVTLPGGGGVRRFEAAGGSRLVESTHWDAAAAVLRSAISETVAVNTGGAPEAGDDTFTDAGGTPLPPADLNPTYQWQRVGGSQGTDGWRVTGVGTRAFGVSSVTYDGQGRISSVEEPAVGEAPKERLSVHYAPATTASAASFGDYAGQVKEITLTTGAEEPQTVARYGYDPTGRLRTVTDPTEDIAPHAAYSYDPLGRLASVESPERGTWGLDFPAGTAAPEAVATGEVPVPGMVLEGAEGINDPAATGPSPADFLPGGVASPMAFPRSCTTAANWLWYTKKGCSAWVAHYGWRAPQWKKTPTGRTVVGVKHDHCTSSPDKPSGFDFRTACDMHDYGYGLIGNTYKNYTYYLDRNRKTQVDDLFYTTLRDSTCPKYRWSSTCKSVAWTYRQGVRGGNPKNGANAT